MRLVTTIKPTIYTAKTKEALHDLMTYGKHFCIMGFGEFKFSGWSDGGKKYGMNFEKRRKKTKVIEIGKRKGKRVIVQEKQWIGRLYAFPKDFPISIKQNVRNFDYTY